LGLRYLRADKTEPEVIVTDVKIVASSRVSGLRPIFAVHHLRSAALLAKNAEALEQELVNEVAEGLKTTGRPPEDAPTWHSLNRNRELPDERYESHIAYVIGSIFAAVAAVEAAVNDFYVQSCRP